MPTIFTNMWNAISNNGWKILATVLIIVVGLILIKIIKKSIMTILRKKEIDLVISKFVTSLISILLFFMLAVVVIGYLGIPTTPFITILGKVGLALALSLQDSISNLASGILIIVNKPFKANDYVSIDGTSGTVKKISIFKTELCDPDNKTIILPNNRVSNGIIINYSTQVTRRLVMNYSVSYGIDIDVVKNVLNKVVEDHPLILDDPKPLIRLNEQASSSLIFTMKVWVKNADYWDTFYDLNELVYKALQAANIEIPYNKLDVIIKK